MVLQIEDVSKEFNGVYALSNISLSIEEGEVHGIVGENGAGKSTLIKILAGVYSMTTGQIYFENKKVDISTPAKSQGTGITVIHQNRTLIPTFNALENIFLGGEYKTKLGIIDWDYMKRKVNTLMQELGISIDLSSVASTLTPSQKVCLEIVRAMMYDCKLLILDEPTACLTEKESNFLFNLIGKLRKKGIAIIYVSHRLEEIIKLTDKITVLKNGEISGSVCTSEINKHKLIDLMTDEYEHKAVKKSKDIGNEILRAEHLFSKDGRIKDASLVVHKNEILGIYGLAGSGRSELLESIYGYRPILSGNIVVRGKMLEKITPSISLNLKMTLICEERIEKELISNASVLDNICLSDLDRDVKYGVIQSKVKNKKVSEISKKLNIKMLGLNQNILELSGGNQQKVVFAKSLIQNPKILLCDEPTQAVDIGTRAEIHRLLRQKAEEGCGIVMVSSDINELLEIADNILVMSNGVTKETLENKGINPIDILKLCYKN
ncbi:MAG: sugar ABC transporter ATP-binding protein [Aminipila sp.]